MKHLSPKNFDLLVQAGRGYRCVFPTKQTVMVPGKLFIDQSTSDLLVILLSGLPSSTSTTWFDLNRPTGLSSLSCGHVGTFRFCYGVTKVIFRQNHTEHFGLMGK